jgi:signal transduction histidine kinase
MDGVQQFVDRAVRWFVRPRTAAVRYFAAVASVGTAAAVTFTIPLLVSRPLFTGFATATAFATLYGGLGPGVAALALSGGLALYAMSRAEGTPPDAAALGVALTFAAFGLLLVLIAHLMRTYALQAERREAQLGRSLAVVKGWAWEYDYATQRVARVADGRTRLSLLNQELAGTREGWRQAVHPDDRERVQKAYEASVAAGNDDYRIEYRVQFGGETFWVEDVVRIERDALGRPQRVVGFALDVTERKQMTDRLADSERRSRAMADALLAADRRKDEFLAMLAHELRNPLAPIRTAATLLARMAPPDPRLRVPIEIVQRQVTHLARIVDDLLDVSRITHDRIELQRAPVAIDEIVAEACETVQPTLQEKRHALRVQTGGAWVDGDRARLVQVVTNLLGNAAKYTPDGGQLEVRAWTEAGDACVSVVDDGTGIGADLLPHVFELFVQGRQTIDRAKGGLGLGLSLVKRLVEMHGGTVEAASDGPGRGATFTVRLPAIEPPATATTSQSPVAQGKAAASALS